MPFRTIISGSFGWQLLAYKCIPISIVLGVAMYFLPESPYYLFYSGENSRGLEAIRWFRTTTEIPIVEDEIKMVKQNGLMKVDLLCFRV